MLTKLAVGIAMMYAAPVSGMMGLSGTTATMANAGFATLCSDATVCLIEKNGDPAKAIQALSKSKIATNVVRSMLTAGLVGEISDVVGIKAINLELSDYAKKAVIQSAVNTVLAVSIDHQNFEKAMLQGMTTAALSTATSYLANQIGTAYSDANNPIDPVSHKLLHGLLGGVSGGVTSKLLGRGFEDGAVSGALGAVVAETMTEMLKPDLKQEMAEGRSQGLSKQEFQEQFMEKAQKSAKWANFTGALTAFTTGQDVEIAHQTGNNATENNFLPGIWLALTVGCTAYEGYQIYQAYQSEGAEAALNHLGIVVAVGITGGLAAKAVFKVGKVVYPTLQEAYKAALANRPMLKSALMALESRLDKIETYFKDQFNWRENFTTERLRQLGKGNQTDFRFNSISGKINSEPTIWTAPTGTGQTYKVWQRTDIDWNHVRTAGDKRFVGKTNAEAAKAGFAPEIEGGYLATLHHINQDGLGNLVEASRKYHGFGKDGYNSLHGIWGKNKGHPTNPVDRPKFDKDTESYWKSRIAGEK